MAEFEASSLNNELMMDMPFKKAPSHGISQFATIDPSFYKDENASHDSLLDQGSDDVSITAYNLKGLNGLKKKSLIDNISKHLSPSMQNEQSDTQCREAPIIKPLRIPLGKLEFNEARGRINSANVTERVRIESFRSLDDSRIAGQSQ